MFERRLKILLGIIIGISVVLLGRAVQLQVVQAKHWDDAAAKGLKHIRFTDTQRGKILDRNGVELAFDAPCVDAAVDYRAISLDEKWIREQARQRLLTRGDPAPANVSKEMLLEDEKAHVRSDIAGIWPLLAKVSGKDIEQIEEKRQEILGKIQSVERRAWYAGYEKAASQPTAPTPWYKRMLTESKGDGTDDTHADAVDSYAVEIDSARKPQVILHDVSDEAQRAIRKAMDRCPGLQLIPSTRRQYDTDAAKTTEHVLGNMTAVPPKDLTKDSLLTAEDLRGFVPGDQVGGGGLERLAEPLLRGTRGEESYESGEWKESIKAAPGKNVRTTIDRDLQHDVAEIFNESMTVPDEPNLPQTFADLHGAAIVLKLDKDQNQVLAMFSNPGFDLNRFDEDFAKLRQDSLNKPLLNRATQQAFQPGSAVKTIIGSVAVTRHLLSPTEGIECTGFLKVPDRAHPGKIITMKDHYRCWTMNLYKAGHHTIPSDAPHVGRYGNPDGFLCLSDALERSCNVYFETVADRLRLSGTVEALQTYGLSRPTGIGIAESTGTLPSLVGPRGSESEESWIAGIGEGDVTATPIQMATVAATLARNGIWMRPRLVMGDGADTIEQERRGSGKLTTPDTVDLHLDPDGLKAVHEGMVNVVNHLISGTGPQAHMDELTVAGKTGSAQISATSLSFPVLDESGNPVHGPDGEGHAGKGPALVTVVKPNQYPWIQGTGENREHLAHAWFIGFAPAENPRVAFCVLVEYGGSGGRVAGPIAKKILEACLKHHYLDATNPPARQAAAMVDPDRELLHPQ